MNTDLPRRMSRPPSQTRRIIERRKHHRILTPPGALFSFKRLTTPAPSGEHTEGEGALVDLSPGGCRLLSDVLLEVGREYNLILQVTKESTPINVETAVVRWTEESTYGLKFTSLHSTDESQLQQLLREIRHPAS